MLLHIHTLQVIIELSHLTQQQLDIMISDVIKIQLNHYSGMKKVFMEFTYGKSIKDLAGVTSQKIGTMKALPDWIMNGAVISL